MSDIDIEKGQSAIEYLMTYGWMLLVVAVVGGAIFGVTQGQGVDSISGFTGGDVIVDDFGLTEEDDLQLDLRSGSGEGVVVKAINVSDESSGEYVYKEFSSNNEVGVGESLVLGLPNVSGSDGGNSLDVSVLYDSGGLSDLSVSGSISGSLVVDETTEVTADGGSGENAGSVASPSVGGEWSHVVPAGSEGGYDYFFDSSTTPYGTTYGGNSSVQYTGDGFYVMKYQASENSSDPGVPQSVSDKAGWNNIPFNSAGGSPNAVGACEALDAQTSGYDIHLTTNREWMTVARQVAQRSENWADGTVGSSGPSGGLYQGNNVDGGSYDRAVDLSSSAYPSGQDFPNAASVGNATSDEVRTHVLSSGDRVWDLSGDLWMWVDADENGSKMSGDSSSKIYERNALNSTVSGGSGLGTGQDFDIDVDAALRSGNSDDAGDAGVFYAFSNLPAASGPAHGFRCSAVPVN